MQLITEVSNLYLSEDAAINLGFPLEIPFFPGIAD